MPQNKKNDKILVISSGAELIDMVKRAIEGNPEIIHATTAQEGLDIARKELPEIIALGYLEPRGATFELQRKIREGWITKNIPLLIVDINPKDPAKRALSMEEGMQMEADEYISLAGDERNAATQLAEPIARLKEKLKDRLQVSANSLKEAILSPDIFAVTWEQIPGRGAFEMQQEELIENARRAASRGKVHAMSVTDNPGGNPAISTEILCTEIKKLGIEPLVHLAFRDKNRNQCESLLYGLAALGVRNLLMLTGDYPATSGFNSRPKPVFDLDSVQGLQLVEKMNAGMEQESGGKKTRLAPTDFFAGAAVSPFKAVEAELMGQYFKLKKKIEAGAKFIITQVGYDARKYHEVLTWFKVHNYNVPVFVNIYLLPYGAARVMNAGEIPGCVVTDKLLAKLDEERNAKDKGRQTRLDRAAKMYAFAKGMGFAGAHIGGHGATYEMIDYIVTKGEELAPKWRDFLPEFDFPQKEGFYYFEKDEKTGLNTNKPASKTAKATHPPIYLLSRAAHATIFNPDSVVFKSFRPIAKSIDGTHTPKHIFESMEHFGKVALFDCQNCGDCGLFDVAFLCPISQCPKNQRNGPCGGSLDGWCEVYPKERKCIWVRAYDRLKGHHEEESIGEYIVPPNNWEFLHTSSWLNFYLGRDHSAVRLGIKPPEPKKKKTKEAPKAEAASEQKKSASKADKPASSEKTTAPKAEPTDKATAPKADTGEKKPPTGTKSAPKAPPKAN
jgi:methylenetetrahydrofolate reductase (NADPH)